MRLLCIALFIASAACAEMVNAIAATVMGEAITIYDINQLAASEAITKRQAYDKLVDTALQNAKIKELDLHVMDDEIDSRIEQIAKRNNMDAPTLKQMITSRGMNWSEYREGARKSILNEKLAANVMAHEYIPISDEEIARYYNAHKNDFTVPAQIVVIQYSSRNERALKAVINNPMISDPDIQMSPQTLSAKELNPRLFSLLVQTPVGKFTPVFPAADRLVTLLVREKNGTMHRELDDVKNEIAAELRGEFERRSVANYFAKLKSSADIVVLRPIF